MNRFIVDDNTPERMRGLLAPCTIVDAAGGELEKFSPKGHLDGDSDYECPRSREELAQIKHKGGGLPLADILRELESRHPA